MKVVRREEFKDREMRRVVCLAVSTGQVRKMRQSLGRRGAETESSRRSIRQLVIAALIGPIAKSCVASLVRRPEELALQSSYHAGEPQEYFILSVVHSNPALRGYAPQLPRLWP